jgi:iron complex transport system substrate-binding protein
VLGKPKFGYPNSVRPLATLVLALAALALGAPAAEAATPKRIVALTPFAANTLAGLGVRPVGVGETLGGKERFASNLRGVERLTLSHPNGPNMEELVLVDPQLVLSSPTWRKGAETMRELDIDVAEVDPANVDLAYEQTLRIGRLVGKRASAETLAERLKRQVAAARRGIHRHPRTLVVLGVGRTPFVMLPNSWGGDVVRRAGARLVTGGVSSRSGFARISDETILRANPDVIIAVPHADSSDIPAVTKFLRSNPAWKDSKAVRDGRLYVSTDNSLLQAGTDVADVIRTVRRRYLDN